MQRAEQRTGEAGGEHAEPRRAEEIGNAIGAHRAHHQRAFEAEIDAARTLGDAFAETDEEKRRGDADGAAEHGERHGPEPDRRVRHQDFPFKKPIRPYIASLASTNTKMMPCSTSTEASGSPRRRCNRPPEALMPPSRIATGMIASGFCRARKATRIPVKP